jgi:DNA segregation ATPase FtsK/SpoIIIE, S-DNA-T family
MNSAYGNTKLARLLLRVAGYVDAVFLLALCCAAASGITDFLWFLFVLALCNVAVVWYASSQGLWFELRVERIWKATCLGLPGMSGTGRSYMRGLKGAYIDGDTKTIYPKIREVHGDAKSFTAYITAFGGQAPSDYNQCADKFAFAFQVPFVSFEEAEDGRIRVRAGKLLVPDVYEPDAYETVAEPKPRPVLPAPVAPLPVLDEDDVEARALLRAVPVGVDIKGRWGMMPIEGNHWLIAGRSGSGKGSFIWQLVGGLELAHQAGLVRLIACDPKRVELGLARPLFEEYADTVENIVALLEKACADLDERHAGLQGRARKFTPSKHTPLVVIIVDELAYVSSMLADKRLATRAETAMKTILALGRAGGYSLVGAAQDPRKETLAFRDMFQYRVALGLPEQMVDLVLGDGMHEVGAYCERLPLGPAGQGCAFVVSEFNLKPTLVRAPWWSDEAIFDMVARWTGVQAAPHMPAYEQGYMQQLDSKGQPLQQWQYRNE